jgi:ABC-type protease/lipase transport system fused ATPase/permease subunit
MCGILARQQAPALPCRYAMLRRLVLSAIADKALHRFPSWHPGAKPRICPGRRHAAPADLRCLCLATRPQGRSVFSRDTCGGGFSATASCCSPFSTIIALLQRLYDPDSGVVSIDGQDISKVTQVSLRSSIAVVQQDISLFHRSLLENLRYGRPDATDDDVYSAVEAARCTEFIDRLPQGFDTMVGERGMKLSGGQRQRLAIARAFLMNAPIVLLDEATSALDTESEQSIQEALSRLFKGRTVIAIAHRLSTLDSFDRIVVLDKGSIVEDGPPRRLLQSRGVYSRMYGRQTRVGGAERA